MKSCIKVLSTYMHNLSFLNFFLSKNHKNNARTIKFLLLVQETNNGFRRSFAPPCEKDILDLKEAICHLH